jgi:hypothetical protein
MHRPSILVSEEGTGETSQNKNRAEDGKGGINFRCQNGGRGRVRRRCRGIGTCACSSCGRRDREGDIVNGREYCDDSESLGARAAKGGGSD